MMDFHLQNIESSFEGVNISFYDSAISSHIFYFEYWDKSNENYTEERFNKVFKICIATLFYALVREGTDKYISVNASSEHIQDICPYYTWGEDFGIWLNNYLDTTPFYHKGSVLSQNQKIVVVHQFTCNGETAWTMQFKVQGESQAYYYNLTEEKHVNWSVFTVESCKSKSSIVITFNPDTFEILNIEEVNLI